MIVQSVGIGIAASLLFTELVGLYAGGLIVPGYLAFFWDQPFRIAMTVIVSLITYAIVVFISQFILIYGRRRFVAAVLIGYIIGWILQITAIGELPVGQDIRFIGYIIPGLIANDMIRQGILSTIISLFAVTAFVRLVLLIVIG